MGNSSTASKNLETPLKTMKILSKEFSRGVISVRNQLFSGEGLGKEKIWKWP
jgi:hypothetical protein